MKERTEETHIERFCIIMGEFHKNCHKLITYFNENGLENNVDQFKERVNKLNIVAQELSETISLQNEDLKRNALNVLHKTCRDSISSIKNHLNAIKEGKNNNNSVNEIMEQYISIIKKEIIKCKQSQGRVSVMNNEGSIRIPSNPPPRNSEEAIGAFRQLHGIIIEHLEKNGFENIAKQFAISGDSLVDSITTLSRILPKQIREESTIDSLSLGAGYLQETINSLNHTDNITNTEQKNKEIASIIGDSCTAMQQLEKTSRAAYNETIFFNNTEKKSSFAYTKETAAMKARNFEKMMEGFDEKKKRVIKFLEKIPCKEAAYELSKHSTILTDAETRLYESAGKNESIQKENIGVIYTYNKRLYNLLDNELHIVDNENMRANIKYINKVINTTCNDMLETTDSFNKTEAEQNKSAGKGGQTILRA